MRGGQPAALCPISCSSFTNIELWVSYIRLLHLNLERYFCIRERMGVMIICPHEFDMALCNITVKSAALSLLLVGHPCYSVFNIYP